MQRAIGMKTFGIVLLEFPVGYKNRLFFGLYTPPETNKQVSLNAIINTLIELICKYDNIKLTGNVN